MDTETPPVDLIAVIGIGCRYPGGVTSATGLWSLVAEGGDGIGPFPRDRGWDLAGLHDPRPRRVGRTYTRDAGFLYDLPLFDADRFGISPREALAMDPQQRLSLEVSWSALRHAGIDPRSLHGSETGVFVGVAYQDYGMPLHLSPESVRGKRITGSVSSVLSGRVAYTLGLNGPAITVDTACSSSLVALHLACQSLRAGESDLALAGGVSAMCTPGAIVDFAQLRGLAPDGRCKAFDSRADGTVWAEGAGVLVLRRLTDARRDGDRVLAVVRGSAVNSDGATEGLRTPSGPAQERVIGRALAQARLTPDEVDLVEAHGTGTPVGDQVEGRAVVAAYGRARTGPLWLGSVKSNIGHSGAAAGVTGMIKVIAAMAHGVLPRSLHVADVCDDVDWRAGQVEVLRDNLPWPDRGRPRRAGVSAFGISGTNAHVVLEQGDAAWPAEPPEEDSVRSRYWLPDHTPLGHPLLGIATEGQNGEVTFTASLRAHPWLAEHQVAGTPILPAAALVECALHVGRHTGCPVVAELVLHAPIPADSDIRLTAGAAVDGSRTLKVEAGGPDWAVHATGVLSAEEPDEAAWATHWPPRGRPVDLDRLYGSLEDRGYHYGPAWRVLRRAWHGADGFLYAETTMAEDTNFVVHPALLDAALHVLGDVDAVDGLPHSFTQVRCPRPGARKLRVRIAVRSGIEVVAADSEGRTALVIGSLGLRGPQAALSPDAGLFRLDWTPSSPLASPGRVAAIGDSPWVGDPRVLFPDLATLARAGVPVPDLVLVERGGSTTSEAVAWALQTIRAWLADPRWQRSTLVVVTRSAEMDLPGAAVWGLLRSARAEHPGRFALVDRDGPLDVAAVAAAAVGESASRGDAVEVAELRPHVPRGFALPRGPWRLVPGVLGSVDDVAPWPVDDPEPGAGQVEIEIRAAGVNFRDVLLALGSYPEPGLMGAEAAGVVRRIGPGVTGLAPGDRVFGLVPGAFGPRVVTDHRFLAPIPPGWSFAVAASVPVAYLTAWHGLFDLGGLRAGETVVVHAAAGGVGQAAVQLARRAGARVFATASPEKQALVRSLGVEAVASSRDRGFAELFRGADLVLNCLTGPLLDASIELLSPGGRLIDLGKLDMRDPHQVAHSHGVTYRAFDLVESAGPDRIAELLAEASQFEPPTPRVWDIRRIAEPLREMRAGTHTGKLVLTVPADRRGTVLITGGTGALGGLLARHLVRAHGVRELVLLSRQGRDDGPLVDDLRALGAEVVVRACDVADHDALREVIAEIGSRLTGVVHAAGERSDGTVKTLTAEQVERVLRPKVVGAWNLHELTAALDLDLFVLFSSAAGVLGAAGQGNYAAANASLDALARHRQALGLPATSLAWGVWAHRGAMTADLDSADLARIARSGVAPLSTADALALFDQALGDPAPVLVPLRRAVVPAAEPVVEGVLALVRREVATVLGHRDADAVDLARPFRDLGFDSLSAVELRNRLSAATGRALPPTLVFDHPSPAALAHFLDAEPADVTSGWDYPVP
ncbi:acyl transferase domain-containing protein/NADPH:quinone reductase-like Zn-dependent oxidoreductase/acyl carrier protein [Actinokineospora baliensis]|uniref:SDR family NAD(P)-dependent oxidoreductase n=1 Tax=Actinokineospora baliensis TaxID=547056 RepID=UPI0019585315|nr:SDR family NAD(P)-dependent oxidoreductase [Actinokineospora baliensis]MBM7774892.1 acyl transferase domain-containing protein/NADPH:quinone reductase-like Zn-dependent oxidoreductase/acyl carrier protein [Actinokineospora baliensis]